MIFIRIRFLPQQLKPTESIKFHKKKNGKNVVPWYIDIQYVNAYR